MLYCDLTYLQGVMPLQKIIECCDDYNSGAMDAAVLANLEACNVSAVTDVHLYCRGLYTVPFDPVPDEIVELTAQLTKYYLLVRRVGDEVSEAMIQSYRRLTDKLKAITSNTFRIDTGGTDVVAEAQGPIVSYTRHRFRQGFMGGLLDDDYPFPEFDDETL
jgi:phage gp36-like protein